MAQATAKIQYVKAGKVPKEANEEVKKQLVMIEAAKIQKEAKDKADAGDYAGAQALAGLGIQLAENNATWLGNSSALRANFANLQENVGDRFTYATVGSRMATSYGNSYATGRAGNMGSIGTSYSSSAQLDMLKAFNVGTSTGSGVKVSLSSTGTEKKTDEEESKA